MARIKIFEMIFSGYLNNKKEPVIQRMRREEGESSKSKALCSKKFRMEDPNIAEVDQEDVAGHKFVPDGLPDWQGLLY